MSSEIVKVIGLTEPSIDGNITRRENFCADTKLEMAQKKEKARQEGKRIEYWYAQSAQGCKMIGSHEPEEVIKDEDVKHVKTIVCPICQGQGSKMQPSGWPYGCPICDGSGITRNGHWKKWTEWQVQEMKEKFETK